MRSLLLTAAVVVFVVVGGGVPAFSPRPAFAEDEAWEANIRLEIEAQDRELEIAKRRGSLHQVATRYASRLSRQPTALNHFLLGRTLYYDGDKEGAERHLRECLRLEPRFWFARIRLAILELERKNLRLAERYVSDVLRVKPRDPDALKIISQIRMDAEDWDGALRALESLLTIDPTDEAVRRNLIFCLMAKKDWKAALGELRTLRGQKRDSPMVRWLYARALFETGDYPEAARELESLLHLTKEPDPRVLDLLRICYAKLEDWKGVQRTLERMLPLVPEGEMRTQIEEVLVALRAGRVPGQGSPLTEDESSAQTQFARLIEKATDPTDVAGRRLALQQYFQSEIPLMPAVLAQRIHPSLESDATCRKWLLRIMGKLKNAALAQVAAYGLYDADAGVQVVAAESIGDIATPSGLLYLLPYFLGPTLGTPATDLEVQRMNAARVAMIHLTGRLDILGGDGTWAKAGDLARMRDDWQVWLAGPAGVHARIEGILDLGLQGEDRPHLYLMEDIQDPVAAISRAAYEVLLQRAEALDETVREGGEALGREDPVAVAMWPKFPRFTSKPLTDTDLPRMKTAVQAWWEAWVAMRKSQR